MLRQLALLLIAGATASHAVILTDNLGNSKRLTLAKAAITDPQIWEEYGLSEAETGRYEGTATKPFTATAWRLKDPTGAQAAFRWLRPAGAKPGNNDMLGYSTFAVRAGDVYLMTLGNYLIRFEGNAPGLEELKIFLFQLPKIDQSALPPVLEYVPKLGMVAGSDRFINGPATLDKFFNKVSSTAAAFHFGTEALVAKYKSGRAELEMALFYYPTNQMARDRQPEFEKTPGAMVKRSGPLVAVVVNPASTDAAERLLSQVTYKAQVTINSPKPGATIENAGNLLIAIFQLAGLLIAIAILSGIMLFAMRALRKRARGGKDEDPMTLLHINDRR